MFVEYKGTLKNRKDSQIHTKDSKKKNQKTKQKNPTKDQQICLKLMVYYL